MFLFLFRSKDNEVTYDGVVDKELDKMEDHEDWNEGIEVNIKTEAPLHVLLSDGGLQQEFVGHVPQTRGNHKTHLTRGMSFVLSILFDNYPNKIHKNDIE